MGTPTITPTILLTGSIGTAGTAGGPGGQGSTGTQGANAIDGNKTCSQPAQNGNPGGTGSAGTNGAPGGVGGNSQGGVFNLGPITGNLIVQLAPGTGGAGGAGGAGGTGGTGGAGGNTSKNCSAPASQGVGGS